MSELLVAVLVLECWQLRATAAASAAADFAPVSPPIQVSPDGGTVASGSWTCLVKLWDIEVGKARPPLPVERHAAST